MMSWDDLRYFLAVHRQGSHKQAARLLRVDATTVSRRLAALEKALDAKLFTRTPERLETTPAGLVLLGRAERIEVEVLASERELLAEFDHDGGPPTSDVGRCAHQLRGLAGHGRLLAAQPELVIEFRTETAVVDLSRREADVALRFVRPKEPALVARRLGELPLGIFASDAYLSRRGTPRTLSAAASHDFIGYHEALENMAQVRWLHRSIGSPRYVLRASTLTSQVIACAEGLGLALLPVFAAGREPRIRQLFSRQSGPTRELWGVFHSDMRSSPRVSRFLNGCPRCFKHMWCSGVEHARCAGSPT